MKISLLGTVSLCCSELCLMGFSEKLPFPINHLLGAQTLQETLNLPLCMRVKYHVSHSFTCSFSPPLLKCVGINWKSEFLLRAKT